MLFDRAMSSDSLADAVWALQRRLDILAEQIEQTRILAAQPMLREFRALKDPIPFREAEFKVCSQFGDDGIIQYVISRLSLPASERRFIEFGVENYRESNTRFLLQNDNWTGLVMDGSEEYVWIGCNSAGNNVYFVHQEYAAAFCHPLLPDDFVPAKFREARDQAGNLSYVGQEEGFALIRDLPVWDVVERKMRVVGDLSR